MAGTLGMAAASLMPGKMNADTPKEPIERVDDKIGVSKNKNGSYTSTAITVSPDSELALELAINKAKNQILESLGLESGKLKNVVIIKQEKQKNNKGNIVCKVTITATLE